MLVAGSDDSIAYPKEALAGVHAEDILGLDLSGLHYRLLGLLIVLLGDDLQLFFGI